MRMAGEKGWFPRVRLLQRQWLTDPSEKKGGLPWCWTSKWTTALWSPRPTNLQTDSGKKARHCMHMRTVSLGVAERHVPSSSPQPKEIGGAAPLGQSRMASATALPATLSSGLGRRRLGRRLLGHWLLCHRLSHKPRPRRFGQHHHLGCRLGQHQAKAVQVETRHVEMDRSLLAK